ncbi:hypothetical protein SH2C18_14570 [Clostridium sediminicola]|uniref:DUF6897 domain-containing protein n=1 Tax=Clostridium sediminicola TaxID=3114879 RepID=UPI0031F24A34
MNGATWISIYLPIFILLFVILPQQRNMHKSAIIKMKKRKGERILVNEIIKKYIGQNCQVSTGSFGISVVGKIINVDENWIEIETKKGNEIINSEFIQSIKIK